MIIQGRDGCICLYWGPERLLISSIPIGIDQYDYYRGVANEMIVDGLRDGKTMKEIITGCHTLCDVVYSRKLRKEKISSESHQYFWASILALIKMNMIDEEEYTLRCGRKKRKKKKLI